MNNFEKNRMVPSKKFVVHGEEFNYQKFEKIWSLFLLFF